MSGAGAAHLANGRAEEVPNAVGEAQAEGAAHDHAEDGAADVAAAQPGAEGTGQGKSDQDAGEGHRDSCRGRRQQDGQHWKQGAGEKGECRSACGLERTRDISRVDVQFGLQVRGQGAMGAQVDSGISKWDMSP